MKFVACPTADELRQFNAGTLSEESADRLAGHLDGCSRCRDTIAKFGGAGDMLMPAIRGARPPFVHGDESAYQRAEVIIRQVACDASSAGFPQPTASDDKLELTHLREYELLEKIGEGGMGAVYKARHAKLDRMVAIKLLPAEQTKDAAAVVARFEREMQAIGRLNHPNVVHALDAGEADGTHFLVMEYVDGVDLSRLVKRHGPLQVPDACELVRQAAIGLQYAHENGLIHRDIKPSNMMLAVSNQRSAFSDQNFAIRNPKSAIAKILDLGLTLLEDSGDLHEPAKSRMTSSGQVMGTLEYMAPEQCTDSRDVDARTDVYSLGATLYKLLSGEAPFATSQYDTFGKQFKAIVTESPTSIRKRRSDLPVRLGRLVDRMLAKDPAKRPTTARDVAAALEPFTKGHNLDALGQIPPSLQGAAGTAEATDAGAEPTPPAANKVPRAAENRMARIGGPSRWTVAAAMLALIIVPSIVAVRRDTSEGRQHVPQASEQTPTSLHQKPIATNVPTTRPRTAALLDVAQVASGEPDEPLERIVSSGESSASLLSATLPTSLAATDQVTLPTAPRSDDNFTRHNREAAEWALSWGGQIKIDGEAAYRTSLPDGPFVLVGIRHGVDLGVPIDVAHIDKVNGLAQLQELLIDAGLTDAALAKLDNLPQLRSLMLSHHDASQVTDASVPMLARYPRLEALNVVRTNLTEDGIMRLVGMPELQGLKELRVSATRAGDEALRAIGKMEQLEDLDIGMCRFTPVGLACLGDLPLTHLNLYQSSADDQGMAEVAKITRLEKLILNGSAVTSAGLKYLLQLPRLREVDVRALKITAADVEQLRDRLPNCYIHSSYGAFRPVSP